jgi:hypothetical protein
MSIGMELFLCLTGPTLLWFLWLGIRSWRLER